MDDTKNKNTPKVGTCLGPLIDEVDNVQSYGSPDCYARIIRYKRRDTRDMVTVDGNPRPEPKVLDISNSTALKGRAMLYGANKADREWADSHVFDIASDIISCTISKTKSSPVGRFDLMLSSADINYHHVLHPGDYIAIFMKRNRTNPMVKNDKAGNEKIFNNDKNSGLKTVGIITDVRRIFRTLPNGRKVLRYRVSGSDLGHLFEMEIYYNQATSSQLETGIGNLMFNQLMMPNKNQSSVGVTTQALALSELPASPDQLVRGLLKFFLGEEIGKASFIKPIAGNDNLEIPNKILFMPRGVDKIFYPQDRVKISLPLPGDRLGRRAEHIIPANKNVKFDSTVRPADFTFMDVLRLRFGVEGYKSDNYNPQDPSPALSGTKLLMVDSGTDQPLWSMLSSYANLIVNEMLFDFKLHTDGDGIARIYPTFTLRQIPFTTTTAKQLFSQSKIDATCFINLPRLKVKENCIYSEDMGRGNALRHNFIQVWGVGDSGAGSLNTPAFQASAGNAAIDVGSIKRYGLKTMLMQSDFFVTNPQDTVNNINWLPAWSSLANDWWMGAHTYESGVFNLIGIEECVSVGDNLEIERKSGTHELYHIEGYTHMYEVAVDGKKSFATNVIVTRGQRIDEYPVYVTHEIDPDKVSDVGFTDVEYEGTARTDKSEKAISPKETPKISSEENK